MSLEIVFRTDLSSHEGPPPAEGEVQVRLATPGARNEVALALVERGLDALARGDGLPRRLAVPASGVQPTFDDMLAALLAERRIAGETLPAGAAVFARYAGLVREGLRASTLPAEKTIEAVYLAIRTNAGDHLADAPVRERFLADWRRMADALWEAMRSGKDPARDPLFEGDAFARERAFLERDHEIFLQDVAGGARWTVRLPGACAPVSARGLLLRKPRSVLWKMFARDPAGEGCLLTAIQWDDRHWVISTDPVQRVPLRALSDALQAAEAAHGSASRWQDGSRHGYTIVASPPEGTKLSDEEIQRVVEHSLSARRHAPGPRISAGVAAVLALAALLLAVLPMAWRGLHHEPTADLRGLVVDHGEIPTGAPGPIDLVHARRVALLIGTDHYDAWKPLSNPIADVTALEKVLKSHYGFHTIPLLDATFAQMEQAFSDLAADKDWGPDDQLLIYIAGHGQQDPLARTGWVIAKDSSLAARPVPAYSHDELRRLVENIPVRHVLLVLDTCFGGDFEDAITLGAVRGDSTLSREDLLAFHMQSGSRAYLTSGGREYVPDGMAGHHSPFTQAFLDALNPAKDPGLDDGIVTLDELKVALQHLKPVPRAGSFSPGGTPEFLFIRGAPASGDVASSN